MGEHVALDVDIRRDLDHLQTILRQEEYRALGDVEHALPALAAEAAAVGDLLHRCHELALAARGECAAEDHGAGILADVDEAAGTDEASAEPAHVDVALRVH